MLTTPIISEIKEHYTAKDVEGILYHDLTFMMTCVADTDMSLVDTLHRALIEYVDLLSPDAVRANILDSAELKLPFTLWGQVPHTLPMMVYRIHSLMEFFSELLPGTICVTDDLAYFYYDTVDVAGNKFSDLVETAKNLLRERE